MSDALHPIQLAARLTGLSTGVIRIWEQRYQAVEPCRTAANHRLYSQNEIERLRLLRDVTHAGHNIGQVARLSNDELRALAGNAPGLELQVPRAAAAPPASDAWLDDCLACVQSLDGRALEDRFEPADTTLLVGGRAMPAYRETLVGLRALIVEDLVQLGLALDRLRQPARKLKR